MSTDLRQQLVDIALNWQNTYGVAPSITCCVSEYDAAKLVGMSDAQYSEFMQDRTAVSRGHDFDFNGVSYQIKAHRPSGKPGSHITNAGKANNYNWDKLIWIRYDKFYVIQEAWLWDRDKYIADLGCKKRISPDDMRKGIQLT
jgi:hypothetical protein